MRNIVYIVVILLGQFPILGQQDARYSQYMYNKLLLNPAVAGSSGLVKMTAFSRNQWASSETLFQANSATFDMSLSQNRLGLGLAYEQDHNGIVKQQTAGVIGSYVVNWWGGYLRFGLQLGMRQVRRDLTGVRIKEENDVLLHHNVDRLRPDLDFGLFYTNNHFYLGYSVKHLMRPRLGFSDRSDLRYSLFHQVMAGGELSLNHSWKIVPSILVKNTQGVRTQVDLVAQLFWKKAFWFGLGARTSQEFNVNAGIAIHEAVELVNSPLYLGYNIDFGFNELYASNVLTHEIVLVIGIKPRPSTEQILKQRKSVNPLFF